LGADAGTSFSGNADASPLPGSRRRLIYPVQLIYHLEELMKKAELDALIKKTVWVKIPPSPGEWYNRSKFSAIDGSIIAFFLGILVLAAIITLAVITPVIIQGIMNTLTQNVYSMVPQQATQFQIGNQTYDTGAIVADLLKGNVSEYSTAP
jgi:hypothetical protein